VSERERERQRERERDMLCIVEDEWVRSSFFIFIFISTEFRSLTPRPRADEEKALEWYEAALKASSNHN